MGKLILEDVKQLEPFGHGKRASEHVLVEGSMRNPRLLIPNTALEIQWTNKDLTAMPVHFSVNGQTDIYINDKVLINQFTLPAALRWWLISSGPFIYGFISIQERWLSASVLGYVKHMGNRRYKGKCDIRYYFYRFRRSTNHITKLV